MSLQRFHAVHKLQIHFEMELGNAMSKQCKKKVVNGDVKKASAICKDAVCEAIAEDV